MSPRSGGVICLEHFVAWREGYRLYNGTINHMHRGFCNATDPLRDHQACAPAAPCVWIYDVHRIKKGVTNQGDVDRELPRRPMMTTGPVKVNKMRDNKSYLLPCFPYYILHHHR